MSNKFFFISGLQKFFIIHLKSRRGVITYYHSWDFRKFLVNNPIERRPHFCHTTSSCVPNILVSCAEIYSHVAINGFTSKLDICSNTMNFPKDFQRIFNTLTLLILMVLICHGAPTLRVVAGSNMKPDNRNMAVNRNKNLHINTNDGSSSGSVDINSHLSKAKFQQMSRLAFESLVSSDYQDDQLEPSEWKHLSKSEKKRLRKEQNLKRREERRKNNRRKSHPGPSGNEHSPKSAQLRNLYEPGDDHISPSIPDKRQAFVIATDDSIKKATCRTMPMKQRVHMEGCFSKVVMNKYCYGQCNSFFIPKLSSNRLRTAFESCSVCQPKEYTPVYTTLQCPTRNPSSVRKRIMTIKECACMPVGVRNEVL